MTATQEQIRPIAAGERLRMASATIAALNSPVVIAPGLDDSGPDHWQSVWHEQYPHWSRVRDCPWERPDFLVWVEALRGVLKQQLKPALVVAHSFGCLATLGAILQGETRIAGALLVAPPDPAQFDLSHLVNMPVSIRATIVASTDDRWMSAARVRHWAGIWQLPLIETGPMGHLNAASSLGDWPQGKAFLAGLNEKTASRG